MSQIKNSNSPLPPLPGCGFSPFLFRLSAHHFLIQLAGEHFLPHQPNRRKRRFQLSVKKPPTPRVCVPNFRPLQSISAEKQKHWEWERVGTQNLISLRTLFGAAVLKLK